MQVGNSGTASNNFHWRNLLDGLLRLSRGNAGSPITDVMRVKADNSVEFPGGIASGVMAAGQSYNDVTWTRSLGTTYTNSSQSGRIILFTGRGSLYDVFELLVNGVLTAATNQSAGSNFYLGAAFIVPAGADYMIRRGGDTAGTIYQWTEAQL